VTERAEVPTDGSSSWIGRWMNPCATAIIALAGSTPMQQTGLPTGATPNASRPLLDPDDLADLAAFRR